MIDDKIREIKRSLRLYQNGVTAESQRGKGLNYKISWGASLGHLRDMAAEYCKDYHLAIELWKSEVRECKILATMIMPVEELPIEVVEIWMEQIPSQEIAEQLVFNLLQYEPYAPMLAYKWMASDNDIYQITAYTLIGRLFMNGQEPNERGINEFLDEAIVALQSTNPSLQHAAMNSVVRFADLGPDYEVVASKAIKRAGFDFL